MRKLLTGLLFTALPVCADWKLVWEHPYHGTEKLAGYKIWNVGATNVLITQVTNNNWTIDLPVGAYLIGVSAVNPQGFESATATIPFVVVPVVVQLKVIQTP